MIWTLSIPALRFAIRLPRLILLRERWPMTNLGRCSYHACSLFKKLPPEQWILKVHIPSMDREN
jgi:hypothetical protein